MNLEVTNPNDILTKLQKITKSEYEKITNDNYECFKRDKINNLKVVTMMKVTDTVLCPMAFEHPVLVLKDIQNSFVALFSSQNFLILN